ncbi:nucleic acid-binding protein [Hypoxylon sp. NC1633]|nr:nucleic acid-binding protein [Hypoxylon sp. NC1633]
MSFLTRRAVAAAPTLSRAFSASARRDLAKITLIGNLGATPQVKVTGTGRELVEYIVATQHGPKDNRKTSWFNVSAFVEEGPRRAFLTSLPKGATVYVEGHCHWRTYEDSEGISKRSFNISQQNLEVLRRPAPAEPPSETPSETPTDSE